MMEKKELFTGLLTLVFGYLLVSYVKYEERPIVEVENGFIRGVIRYTYDYRSQYKAFYGIPFAKPPVGELRFEAPQPATNWSGIRDASSYRSQCIQTDILWTKWSWGSEDCLFINVFVPLSLTTTKPTSFPILLFIHGGYWHLGSSSDHGESYFMKTQNIILVSFNYRLGAFGFLSTGGDGTVRGNMGLKDQVMALGWVQNNIKKFGGNPNQVTIFGESVGGTSCQLHILSPASRGLFHRAISMSGTALNFFATNSHAEVTSQSKHFAEKFSCPTENSIEMIQCLRQLDAKTIVNAHGECSELFNRNRLSMFGPTIEVIDDKHAFLSEDPLITLQKGNFQKIPWITGVNSHEGLFGSAVILANETKKNFIKNEWKTSLPSYLWYNRDDKLTEKIRNFYFGPFMTDEEFARNLTSALSDRAFFHPLSKAVNLYSKHAQTYVYYFNYRTFYSLQLYFGESESYVPAVNILINSLWRTIQEFVLGWPIHVNETCHANELPLMFTLPWTPYFMHMIPERDAIVSDHLIQLWTSFARSWDTLMYDDVEWKSVNASNKLLPFQYLEISQNPKMIEEPFSQGVEFWNSIEQDILKGRK